MFRLRSWLSTTPLDEAEVIRQQVRALFHDEHAGGVQREALFKVLGVVVVRRAARHEQQRVVVGGALRAAHDHAGRVGIIVEAALVELVVLLVLDLALLLFPDGHHAVQGLELGVALVLGLVVGGGVRFGLFLFAALLAVHLDGIAHIVAVLS
jgi:hypothetical protein